MLYLVLLVVLNQNTLVHLVAEKGVAPHGCNMCPSYGVGLEDEDSHEGIQPSLLHVCERGSAFVQVVCGYYSNSCMSVCMHGYTLCVCVVCVHVCCVYVYVECMLCVCVCMC